MMMIMIVFMYYCCCLFSLFHLSLQLKYLPLTCLFVFQLYFPLCSSLFRSGSNRAYKVAGVTLLACVLIAGQAMIAYFLLNQKAEIKSLEEQSDNLRSEMNKGRMNGGGI